ncbi:MAG: hypothetical protein AAGF32_09155 [Pseudomonadota bacterium]
MSWPVATALSLCLGVALGVSLSAAMPSLHRAPPPPKVTLRPVVAPCRSVVVFIDPRRLRDVQPAEPPRAAITSRAPALPTQGRWATRLSHPTPYK